MRRLLFLAFSWSFVLMFIPHGVLMNTPDTGQGNEPVLMQDSAAPQAVLMHSPDSVLMSDGNEKCADIGMRTLALTLLGVNYQNALALKIWRNPTVALCACVRKPGVLSFCCGPDMLPDNPTIKKPGKPKRLALRIGMRNPAVALTCFLRKPKPERPLIVTTRNPVVALDVCVRKPTVRS